MVQTEFLLLSGADFSSPAGQMEAGWPEYPASMALLSEQLQVVHDYSSARCELWKNNSLSAYAWIN